MKYTLYLTIMLVVSGVQAQIFSETIKQSFDPANVLYVANVNGSIDVQSYDGSVIEIVARKEFRARSQKELTEIKEKIKIARMDKSDTLIIYLRGVGDCFCEKSNSKWGGGLRYMYHFRDWDSDYEFSFDFTIKVPKSTNLILSTINDGDITVDGTTGSIRATNVNGALILDNVSGQVIAHTINGDVDVNFTSTPLQDSRFYTLNGDITANFKGSLNAELGFKSYNGDLYTNINELEYLPTEIEKTESKDKKGIKYKIRGYTAIKVRKGGVKMDFETFNGDVFIKEILN